MRLVRDQWDGGRRALSERYHPMAEGLSKAGQEQIQKMRRHVNLVEPAIDRLVNSIHAGEISRKCADEAVRGAARRPGHVKAMAKLCENAFAYGTGFLAPVVRMGKRRKLVRYWVLDSLYTVPVTDPMDTEDLVGVVSLMVVEGELAPRGFWFFGKEVEGFYRMPRGEDKGELVVEEHGLGFVPVVMAFGRDRRDQGEIWGKSLVLPAAYASIAVTNNALNTDILRNMQTQSLMVIWGETRTTSMEQDETKQKFVTFPSKDEGDVAFRTPESRLDQVIKVGERTMTDTSVSTGLPLDTYRPEIVTGGDASATAARQRAFPLQQRMVRLCNDWMEVEIRAMAMLAALFEPERWRGWELEEVADEVGAEVRIRPSIPQSESETLATWIQATEKFFVPVEEAVGFYSGHLLEARQQELADKWRAKYDPTGSKAGEIFQYHLEAGVVTFNEVRDRLGLDQTDWGNMTVPQASQAAAGHASNTTLAGGA